MLRRFLAILAGVFLGGVVLLAGAAAIAIIITYPRLQSLDVITDYRPKIPLRVYSADNQLLGEFGEERRSFSRIHEVPQLMKQAVLAAEDERFYQHSGIDYLGIMRAAVGNLVSGHARSGASTITMQVAKNFFLSSEKTFTRKFNEALLAFKIEHTLSKDQILELYFNQIYLGQRAYGFAAAAQTYYGKSLNDLSPAQMAMLAGLPKAPSAYNPIVNPDRAKLRQQYVLRRMRELNFITQDQYEQALNEPLHLAGQAAETSQPGQYVAEMVRQAMYERYKEAAYTEGFKVYTTVDSRHQKWAYDALRAGLIDYDRKTGYRGPESFLDLPGGDGEDATEALDEAMGDLRDSGDMLPAIVLSASPSEVRAYMRGGKIASIKGAGLDFARRALSSKASAQLQIRRGAVIRVQANPKGYWEIVEMPEVEGAFVSLDTRTGAIKSLIGGFDFNRRSFNHVTQAWRQPGSSFKPFIYSSGIERGITPSTLINDAPLSVPGVNGQLWTPKNDDGKFSGMITLRQGLTRSKNLVSVRVLMAVGTDYAQQYIQRFGFSAKQHPAYLPMALGAGSVTPLQMVEGYSVFANGGYRTKAFFIDRIEDQSGRVLAKTVPTVAGQNAQQAIDPRNAFIMRSMLGDVVRYGTGFRAMSLGRTDLAGKTGTTSDWKDAWFVGFNPNLVAATWVGFDQPRSLGRYGYGGTAALPIWINYMGNALKGQPEVDLPVPQGIVVKPGAGQRGGDEYYYEEFQKTNPELRIDNQGTVPGGEGDASAPQADTDSGKPAAQDAVENVKDQLF
ncbi:penicillin-binding protein [Chromobacterium violaceum]|uniref:penicillin-binding protein 1A n=1 Tax=Chromobacterium violaceum TaxID=536 RepID=UPI0005BBF878|nr:penicillin-binding protein [Chromobacterium violaceum]KMN87125.1 penicillin-binding protein [Chromobacterium violaceum]KMN89751.1 penicillin-binding protein [Chromobacterium violaceum]KMO03795.1 penicillin-binding protein [Chromobacterium violaceum]OQS47337.1 penicillin-binding protein [Chromobacterium violaceum]